MNRIIRDRWIAALRSGEYQQGRELLRTKDGTFCCLGVLCVVENEDIGPDRGYLDDEFRQAIDLSSEQESILIDMNDKDHRTFGEIADYIEGAM